MLMLMLTVGQSANYAVVLAQLFTGRQHCGLHAFLVQLRDVHTHLPLPGLIHSLILYFSLTIMIMIILLLLLMMMDDDDDDEIRTCGRGVCDIVAHYSNIKQVSVIVFNADKSLVGQAYRSQWSIFTAVLTLY